MTNAYQSDVYTFTGTAGESTYFEILSQSNGESGATWNLFGPNNVDVANSNSTDFAATLPAAGNYTLAVDNSRTYPTATYSFEAFQNVDPTSNLTTLGGVVNGTIVNPGDSHTYTFTGAAGQGIYSTASPQVVRTCTPS